MTCADLEILLCDYVDGTLHGAQRSALENHLANCGACASLARDSAAAVDFMERSAAVDPPPELLTRILFEIGKGRPEKRRSWLRRRVGALLEPILQPRFAMGMAMTVLSFAMLGRYAGVEIRQLRPADLDPVKVWTVLDDKVHRSWERAVKYYDSLRVVYEVQARLKEWRDQAEADSKAQSGAKGKQGPAPSGQEKSK